MHLSSLADAPPLIRPPWRATSPIQGVRASAPTSPKKTRQGNASQTSIDALFSDDVAGSKHQSKTSSTLGSKHTRGQAGDNPIADLFASEDLHIPGLKALAEESGKKVSSGKKKEKSPARSLAFSLGNEMLEADLRSLAPPASESDIRSSPRTPREDFLLDRQKRVALVQQMVCPEGIVELNNNDIGRPLNTATKSPPPTIRSKTKKLVHRPPDKVETCQEDKTTRSLEQVGRKNCLDVDQNGVRGLVVGETSQMEKTEMAFLELMMEISLEVEMTEFHYLTVAEDLMGEEEEEFLEVVDDDWGETDVLMMLPDSSEIEAKEMDKNENSTIFQKTELSKAEPASEFGDYQPSILSGPKRAPLAGRRSSPEKGTLHEHIHMMEMSSVPAIKKSYIKLKREPETQEKTFEPGTKVERLSTCEESCSLITIQSTNTLCDNMEMPPTLQRKDSSPVHLQTETSEGFMVAMDCSETVHQPLFDIQPDHINERSPSPLIDAHQISSPAKMLHQVLKSPRDDRRPRTPQKEDEELSRREKAFCDLLLAERNLLQNKLETERDSFLKERDTLQMKLAAEMDGFMKERETLQTKLDTERETFIKERETLNLKHDAERKGFVNEKETLSMRLKSQEDELQRDLQQILSAKEISQKERDTLLIDVKNLREENLMLKEEVLSVENERLAFERQVSEAEHAHEDALMKKLDAERDKAQRIASQLSSEVQLLKSSSIMAEERMISMQKLHEQELQMLNTVHLQELEAKDKQLEIERKFLMDHKMTMDKLSQLFKKGDEWAVRVDVLQGSLAVDRELSSNDRQKWLGALDHTVTESQAVVQKWEDYCSSIRQQLDQLVAVLELGVMEVKTMRLDEKDRLDKEHSHLKALQGALQEERAQSLTDLTAAHQKLEEMRTLCFLKKEEFLNSCTEERKNIAAERGAVIQMREQLVHAEVAFEKQIMEHTVLMQAEAGESAKQLKELERAKEMAAELAEEVDEGRFELERQRHAFEQEIASVQTLSAQAQQKIESALEMKREAAQLRLEAEGLRSATAIKESDIENQRMQAAMAHNELLELKRKHDEERMRLAIERQQLCSKRNRNDGSHILGQSLTSQSSVRPLYDSKSQLFDIPSWNSFPKGKRGQQVSVMPTRASLLSENRSSSGQPPWVVENIKVSLYLQDQEDFLAQAKRELRNTTSSTNNLLTRTNS